MNLIRRQTPKDLLSVPRQLSSRQAFENVWFVSKNFTATGLESLPPRGSRLRRRVRDTLTHADRTSLVGPSANGSCTLGAQRCRGLLTIAFGLLFIFRSHYFYTIGLDAIFSLRRTSPADLHFTLKKRDSWETEGVGYIAPNISTGQ